MQDVTIAMVLKKSCEINTIFGTQELKMSWADGMIGVMPVFESREAAEAYVEGSEFQTMSAVARWPDDNDEDDDTPPEEYVFPEGGDDD